MIKFQCLFIVTFLMVELSAQQSVLTGGGDASGTSGEVSYSIGQVAYQNFFSNSGSSAEGVQQPYEISIVTDVDETNSHGIDLISFPNPVADYFDLLVTPWEGTDIEFRVLDISGKLVHRGAVSADRTSIDARHWSGGQYVIQMAAPVNQSIRIIKIH